MGTMTLSETVASYLKWCQSWRSPATVQLYRLYLERFCKSFEGRALDSIRTIDVESWTSRRHPLEIVRTFFRWVISKAGVAIANPCKDLPIAKSGHRSRLLARVERVRLRRRASRALRDFLLAVEETGARPGEWRAARWEWIQKAGGGAWTLADVEAGVTFLRLNRYKGQLRRDNPHTPRLIPISARLGRLLVRLARRCVTLAGPILRSSSGSPWSANALRCSFRRVRAAIGFQGNENLERPVIYSYRHTKATELARAGVNVRLLADFLGHSTLDLLCWYVHPSEEDLCNLVRRTKRPFRGDRENPKA